MSFTNAGPSSEVTINTVPPRSTHQFIQTIAVSMTPVAVAAATTAEQSFGSAGVSQVTAATGMLPGDVVLAVSPPSLTAGTFVAGYRVDTAVADKFYVEFGNSTAGSLTPASGVYLVTVARFVLSASTTPGTLSTLPASITSN